MEIIDIALKLSQVGSAGLMALAILGALKGWWVPGRTYEESVRREAAWREMYEREKAARENDRARERGAAT